MNAQVFYQLDGDAFDTALQSDMGRLMNLPWFVSDSRATRTLRELTTNRNFVPEGKLFALVSDLYHAEEQLRELADKKVEFGGDIADERRAQADLVADVRARLSRSLNDAGSVVA